MDGYSSHVNMEFVNWADQHSIILLILLPHTTYRLQLLDIRLFQPLSTYYLTELDQMMNEMAGQVTMSKGFFGRYLKKLGIKLLWRVIYNQLFASQVFGQ
jgi:hypothetical protein